MVYRGRERGVVATTCDLHVTHVMTRRRVSLWLVLGLALGAAHLAVPTAGMAQGGLLEALSVEPDYAEPDSTPAAPAATTHPQGSSERPGPGSGRPMAATVGGTRLVPGDGRLTRGPAPGLVEPWWRFTLFCRLAGTLEDRRANRVEVDDRGRVIGGLPPLVLVNARQDPDWLATPLETKARPRLEAGLRTCRDGIEWHRRRDTLQAAAAGLRTPPEFLDLLLHGYIYLGNPTQQPLRLNLTAGLDAGPPLEAVGEGHLFYQSAQDFGWRLDSGWDRYLAAHLKPPGLQLGPLFVDTGLWHELPSFGEQSGRRLFDGALPGNPARVKTSALHLFGWPHRPSPALVFGPVRGRHLRSYALGAWPTGGRSGHGTTPVLLRRVPAPYYESEVTDVFNRLCVKHPWITIDADDLADRFVRAVDWFTFDLGIPAKRLGPLAPVLRETPIVMTLPLQVFGTATHTPWLTFVQTCSRRLPAYLPQGLGLDFVLRDPNPHPPSWPRTLTDTPPPPAGAPPERLIARTAATGGKLADPAAVPGHRLTELPDRSLSLSLDTVLFVPGDATIDRPIVIERGGVIVCEGTLTLRAPIRNACLIGSRPAGGAEVADRFVTLIAPRIVLDLPPAPFGRPTELHAFLVALDEHGTGRLETSRPFHLIGGVAVDRLDDLTARGGIIEYAFKPLDPPTMAPRLAAWRELER